MYVPFDFSLCRAYRNVDNVISLPLLYTWNFTDTNYVCCQFLSFFFLSFFFLFPLIRHFNAVTITAIVVLSPGLHLGALCLQKVVEVPGTPVNVRKVRTFLCRFYKTPN